MDIDHSLPPTGQFEPCLPAAATRERGLRGIAADRVADLALVAAALTHVVLIILFALSLAMAVSGIANAASPDIACGGSDLVQKLAADAPDKLAAIEAEAATTANGLGILWRVGGKGAPDSWLLGTMHSSDARITGILERVETKFDTASTVIIESTDSLDPSRMAAAMAALRQYSMLAPGKTLDTLLPGDDRDALRQKLQSRGLPWEVARQMQPWLLTASLALPLCELQAKAQGKPVLDTLIGTNARNDSKQLVGLESIEEQFRAVASIPFEFHVNALLETLDLGNLSDDMMATTKILYLEEKIGWMLPLVRVMSPKTYQGKGYAEFQELLLTNRNHLMAQRATPHLEKGNAFMAVGALHLPGSEGLIELLREQGFTVERIPL